MPPPLVVISAVGLTRRLLPLAPRLNALAQKGWATGLREVVPAVTCTAQATLLTGELPNRHGIVANGWLYRDTHEVRFWQQSNRLIAAEPVYATARRIAAARGRTFRCAKLFWWFNQGAAVDLAVTPKPHYGHAGGKRFDIQSYPAGAAALLKRDLGPFPFAAFWGPLAGIDSTRWIAAAAALVLLADTPDLTLVYLPHLDYDPQRRGPGGTDMALSLKQLDGAAAPLLDAAAAVGARVWVVGEYGHVDVKRAVTPNRALRRAGLLAVRDGPFGEQLDLYGSRAFAVCDHQLAHVYVADDADIPKARDALAELPGVARVLTGPERAEFALDHDRAGEIVLLSDRDAWFAYPFWLDDRHAPDYARCVAIHAKPGFDPCEMFFDPKFRFPKLHLARRLAASRLGVRASVDVVPLDPSMVGGSHGLPALDPLDRPAFIGDGPAPGDDLPMTAFRDRLLSALFPDGETSATR